MNGFCIWSADECSTAPNEEYADDYACAEVDDTSGPVSFVAKHQEIIGKRWECGESSTETCDKEDVFARGHDVGFFEKAEEKADNEASDDVDKERAHRKRAVEHAWSPFAKQIATASADKTAASC